MSTAKTPCPYQGPGKQNPADVGGYDMIRPTEDSTDTDYWITSGNTTVYDAGYDDGRGGLIHFQDRIRISKGASDGCSPTVTLDVEANPLVYSYYPPHSLDVIFVLDVTASMMSGGSRKMALAKRALSQTIQLLWQQNKETRVTIVPFARDAYVPLPGGGLSYDYLGTLFTWRRSTTSGNRIGQILGYRNGSYVSATDIPAYMAQSAPIVASTELSLYNYYNYYKIRYSDIYEDDGTARTDTVLSRYLSDIYAQNPGAYAGNFIQNVATGTPLDSTQLPYSMNDTGYESNTILDNLIWAIPYGEDTNTEAGLNEAYVLFTTPGFAQSDDLRRRAVILITDGQANRSVNPEYPDRYATPGSTDGDYLPSVPGEPWRYFMYLQQTVNSLISEIANRSSTSEELVLALRRAWETAGKIKDPAGGNASVFVLGIEIGAQSPGPYTREDVLDIMRTIASTGSYLHEAAESGSDNPIIEELERLARYLFILTGGPQATITDTINTALFDYVPGTIRITGEQDGIRLKSRSAPDITDPADPDYTVYTKPALLPDISDANVQDGVITVGLGEVPYPPASPDSRTRVRVTYQIKNKGPAHGSHLHTDNDEETLVTFQEANHLDAASTELTYDNPPRILHFQTPVISCHSGFTVEKFVGTEADNVIYKTLSVSACQVVYYRIVVHNYTDAPLNFPLLYEVMNVRTAQEAQASPDRRILAENFTVPVGSSQEYTFQSKTHCSDIVIPDYAILETGTGILYDNAVVAVKEGSAHYTVQYLNRCTGMRICPDKLVTGVYPCEPVDACSHIHRLPCWKFVCACPYRLDLCEGENIIKLYYVPR